MKRIGIMIIMAAATVCAAAQEARVLPREGDLDNGIHWMNQIIISNRPPRMTISLMKDDKIVQTLRTECEYEPNDMEGVGDLELQDVNFDGHNDILVTLGYYGNQATAYKDCFIYDPAGDKYDHCPSFSKIESPMADDQRQFIYSESRSSANEYVFRKYQFQKGRFVKLYEQPMHYYNNERFAFSVPYTVEMKPQGEPQNGDGQVFIDDDGAKLHVFAAHNALDKTMRQLYDENRREDDEMGVCYDDLFKRSGTQGNQKYYQEVRIHDNVFYHLVFTYPAISNKAYDNILETIVDNWDTGN